MSRSYRTGEWSEPRGHRDIRHVANTRAIVASIINFHNAEVLPTQSSHYRIPGAVGSVLIPEQLRLRYEQPEEGVGYTDAPTNVVELFLGRLNMPDDAA